MVKVKIDMTGWKMWEHGVPDSKLTVIEQVEDYISPNGKHQARWLCECNCDKKSRIIVDGRKLRATKGNSVKSCGCFFRKYNDYILNLEDEHGLYGIGYCKNTGHEFYFDMDDYDKIKDYCWSERKRTDTSYRNVRTRIPGEGKWISIHYLIVGKYYDHADRNTFNNRKYNLRKMTQQENARNGSIRSNNTSGFIGVSLHKRTGKWRSHIMIDGKQIHLGTFDNKEEAIKTRLEAEAKYFSEFAPQRHLFEEYNIKV